MLNQYFSINKKQPNRTNYTDLCIFFTAHYFYYFFEKNKGKLYTKHNKKGPHNKVHK